MTNNGAALWKFESYGQALGVGPESPFWRWFHIAWVATSFGEERLKRWLTAGGAERTDDAENAQDIAARAAVIGDIHIAAAPVLRPFVNQVLLALPVYALEFVRDNASLVIIGGGIRAWATSRARLTSQTEATRVAAVPMSFELAADSAGLLIHEVAHAILGRPLPLDAQTPEQLADAIDRRDNLLSLAHEWKRTDVFTDEAEQEERACCALVHALGFVGPGANGEGCAKTARGLIERQAAEAAANRVEP